MRLSKEVSLLFVVLVYMLPVFSHNRADTVITINIKAKAGLQFDLVRFSVEPGTKIRIVFTNTDDMSHNLLITKPGARLKVVNEALALGEKGPALNYTPKSSSVLWSVPVVMPDDKKSITFTAPHVPGVYPYVCTLPGHGFVMYGAMYVTKNKILPERKKDINIPPSRRNEKDNAVFSTREDMHGEHTPVKVKALHPYTPVAPYLYRVFIDGASPAAIAVNLPHNISYCWDAGTCRLRFAWTGGFLDNSDLWKGKGDATAKVVGTIFFRDTTLFPLRISSPETIPMVDYKGYRLINRYPEFHYTLNGLDVYELIMPKTDGSGLVRTFKIPSSSEPVWFLSSLTDSVSFKESSGKWIEKRLLLSAEESRQFTITITKNKTAL